MIQPDVHEKLALLTVAAPRPLSAKLPLRPPRSPVPLAPRDSSLQLDCFTLRPEQLIRSTRPEPCQTLQGEDLADLGPSITWTLAISEARPMLEGKRRGKGHVSWSTEKETPSFLPQKHLCPGACGPEEAMGPLWFLSRHGCFAVHLCLRCHSWLEAF